MFNHINSFVGCQHKLSKQDVCFAYANQVWAYHFTQVLLYVRKPPFKAHAFLRILWILACQSSYSYIIIILKLSCNKNVIALFRRACSYEI